MLQNLPFFLNDIMSANKYWFAICCLNFFVKGMFDLGLELYIEQSNILANCGCVPAWKCRNDANHLV